MADDGLNCVLVDADDNNSAWNNAVASFNRLKSEGKSLDYLDMRIRNADSEPAKNFSHANLSNMSKEFLATYNKEGIDWSHRLIDPYTNIDGVFISLNMPNPLKEIAKKFQYGFGQNQAVLEVSMPSDNGLGRQRPNLALIDFRVRYDKLHLITFYTSMDLGLELPANLAGLYRIMKDTVDEINDRCIHLLPQGKKISPGEIFITCPDVQCEDVPKIQGIRSVGDIKNFTYLIEPEQKADMKIFSTTARQLDELWFNCLDGVLESGYNYNVEHGSFEKDTRIEFDFPILYVEKPETRPLAPCVEGMGVTAPTSEVDIQKYYEGYCSTPVKAEHEDYSYARRIADPHIPIEFDMTQLSKIPRIAKEIPTGINQLESALEKLGRGEKNVVLEIGRSNDLFLESPPCARIYCLKEKNGALHGIIYFRSWDLYNGLPQNLGGFQLMREDLAQAVGLKPGKFLCRSKGLHVYGHAEEMAKIRTHRMKEEDSAVARAMKKHEKKE